MLSKTGSIFDFRTFLVILFGTLSLAAQPDLAAVNDSILKYIIINPPVALNFGLTFPQS